MKKTSYILALLAAASALLISSCAKETGNGFDAVLSFSTDTPELIEVKAAAVTSVSDFYTIGYAGTEQWFPNSGDPERVQVSGGSATFSTYIWKTNESKTFFAYSNNLPASGATASITSSGVTLTYTAIPTDASSQTDVTLGRYSGNGSNTGTAAMTFYHPLAQVVFKMGDMVGVSKIDKIEIKGVYSAGTTTLSTSTGTTSVTQASGSGTAAIANFSWTGTSGSATVSQTVNSLPAKDSEIGVPFMLIPQSFNTKSVVVKISAIVNGEPLNLTTTLMSGSLAAGKKTVCTLEYLTTQLTCTLSYYNLDDDFSINSSASAQKYDDDYSEDMFPIIVTVNSEGKKVQFSRGNLWVDTNTNPVQFHFEKKQFYYRVHSKLTNNTALLDDGLCPTPAGTVGTFFWEYNEAEAYAANTKKQAYGSNDHIFTNIQTFDARGETEPRPDFTVDGQTGVWRTLSIAEWEYICLTRIVNGGTGEGKTFQNVEFIYDGENMIDGFLIYPDGYTGQNSVPARITRIPAGCVFLPKSITDRVAALRKLDWYCSSSLKDDRQQYYFDLGDVKKGAYYRDTAVPIRLVKDVVE